MGVAWPNKRVNLMHSSTLLYEDLLGDLPATTREAFQAIEVVKSYPASAQLFVIDQGASGIFVIHAGSVSLSESPREENLPISRKAGQGEILGLPATLSGNCHQAKAETLEASDIGFIDREDLLYFLHGHAAAAFRLVQLLSHTVDAALEFARLLPPAEEV